MSPPKKTIAIDIRSYEARGIGRYLQLIVPEIIKDRIFNVVLIGPSRFKYYKEFEAADQYIEYNIKPFSVRDLIIYPQLKKADLVWIPNIHIPWLYWLIVRPPYRKVITIHDVNPLSLKNNNYSLIKRNILRFYYFFAITLATKIITGSPFSKTEILRFFPIANRKLSIINYGFSIPNIKAKKEETNVFASDFLAVSSYRSHKNIDRLLRVFMMLAAKLPQSVFRIAGVDINVLPRELQKQIMLYENNIFLMGYVDEQTLQQLYLNTNGVVVPSMYEGFGYPVLEAVFYDKPVFCSDIPPFHDIMGENANYFNPVSEQSIFQVLFDGINGNKKIDRKKYDLTKAKYSSDRMVNEHIFVFNGKA